MFAFVAFGSSSRARRLALPILSILFGAACQTPEIRVADARLDAGHRQSLRETLPIFDRRGARQRWHDLMSAVALADIAVLGEQHDDAVAHAAQLAIFEDALARRPATMLSMEMIDRRHQATVDDYLRGLIDCDTFLEELSAAPFRRTAQSYLQGTIDRSTFKTRILSLSWPEWERNYQPMIDAAKDGNTHVIAANTPWRRYASLANRDGFDALETLTPAQQSLVTIPAIVPEGDYRTRFREAMGVASDTAPAPRSNTGAHESSESDAVEGMYRAQCVMDATMTESIILAVERHRSPVVHLVGQFHSDFDGGLIQQLRHARPQLRIVTISFQPEISESHRREDRDRADYVIYTGQHDAASRAN